MTYSALTHLNADKVDQYRAVLGVFTTAREQFVIALRPADVVAALAEGSRSPPVQDFAVQIEETAQPPRPDDVPALLDQLVAWGNLVATRDTADVASVEDFYRPRYLYQLTIEGEAAEQALSAFHEHLLKPGELQTTALRDIVTLLDEIESLLEPAEPDVDKLFLAFTQLVQRFEQMTARAQSFMRGLHGMVELHEAELETVIRYKDDLIDYLERFLSELVLAMHRVGTRVETLAATRDLERVFTQLAHRETADALQPTEQQLESAGDRWRQRWVGLRRWFTSANGASQAELLRARTRAAIPALLAAISSLNERRTQRTDRVADFLTLARWFAMAPDDSACHRLWRVAFALSPARHLRIDDATVAARESAGESVRTSWLKGVPVAISPRLRRTGHWTPRGGPRAVIDRTVAKAHLAELVRRETEQVIRARDRLGRTRKLRLAELGPLDPAEFNLFLDLLGEALTRKSDDGTPIEAFSSDGSLRIRLEPVPGAPWTTLETAHGRFRGPDHTVTITPARSVSVSRL
jgi:uncharacterized protein (TIGR02677 family)